MKTIEGGDFKKFSKKKLKLRFTVPKNVKGGPWGFLKLQFVAKYQKIECGPFGDILKISRNLAKPKRVRRMSHSAEKMERVTHLL